MLPTGRPGVIYKPLSDGAVLFSTVDEVYFGLNTVGAQVWELLPPARRTLDEVCDDLCQRYPDAAPERLRADICQLLAELTSHGLVVPAGGDRAIARPDASVTPAADAAQPG